MASFFGGRTPLLNYSSVPPPLFLLYCIQVWYSIHTLLSIERYLKCTKRQYILLYIDILGVHNHWREKRSSLDHVMLRGVVKVRE